MGRTSRSLVQIHAFEQIVIVAALYDIVTLTLSSRCISNFFAATGIQQLINFNPYLGNWRRCVPSRFGIIKLR